MPTPNEYRTASGAPGPKYWQQRCDYDIKCQLDEKNLKLTGSELVTYFNNSPNTLTYLWLQLDENEHSTVNNANYQANNRMTSQMSQQQMARIEETDTDKDNGYGFFITKLTDVTDKKLSYTINKTMMRVDLPKPIAAGASYSFKVSWWYNINDRFKEGGRSGYEFFPKDSNYLYAIAQFFPRMCVYDDINGWQNKQFLGGGEFTLVFGDYDVKITVPADHAVAASLVLLVCPGQDD
jgi:hypothetical protein